MLHVRHDASFIETAFYALVLGKIDPDVNVWRLPYMPKSFF